MTTAMMMDRTGMMMPGMAGGMPAPTGMAPAMPHWMMVPRCTIKMEKVSNGMRMTCTCDEPAACGMMQNLCQMMAGGMVSCCCVMNGMVVCCCNLTMGMCRCEMTKDGCVMTYTSGDADCCKMIQACCDCMTACMAAGCTCCVMMNNTPVCCGSK